VEMFKGTTTFPKKEHNVEDKEWREENNHLTKLFQGTVRENSRPESSDLAAGTRDLGI